MAYEWMDKAKCLGTNPGMYELDQWGVTEEQKQATARELCAGCIVTAECAADSLRHRDQTIVRGGVWIPSPWHKSQRKARAALRRVAAGGQP